MSGFPDSWQAILGIRPRRHHVVVLKMQRPYRRTRCAVTGALPTSLIGRTGHRRQDFRRAKANSLKLWVWRAVVYSGSSNGMHVPIRATPWGLQPSAILCTQDFGLGWHRSGPLDLSGLALMTAGQIRLYWTIPR